MIDLTIYENKAVLQLLKSNPKFSAAIVEKKTWNEVVDVINTLNVKYQDSQLEYVKEKTWIEK